MKKWITIKEAEEISGKSSRTIRRYIDTERKLRGGKKKVKNVCKYIKNEFGKKILLINYNWLLLAFQDDDYKSTLLKQRRQESVVLSSQEDEMQTEPQNLVFSKPHYDDIKELYREQITFQNRFIEDLKERNKRLEEEKNQFYEDQKAIVNRYEVMIDNFRKDMRLLMEKYESVNIELTNLLASGTKSLNVYQSSEDTVHEEEIIETPPETDPDKISGKQIDDLKSPPSKKSFTDFLKARK